MIASSLWQGGLRLLLAAWFASVGTTRGADGWVLRPLTRPAVPSAASAVPALQGKAAGLPVPEAVTNPVDRFLLARLREQGLSFAPDAEPRTLIRRLHFVLTGLPPTPEEVEAFVRECSLSHSPTRSPASGAGGKVGRRESESRAVAALVDRLLSSPHFGERFARHWMDVVRYADTHGTEHDAWLPHAWRYRDYLIRAFNRDLPYDQFVREHVAGDLLDTPRWSGGLNESLLATAWWRLVECNQTPVDVKGEEALVVDNQIDALGKAFLGLTVACARCHDHKFDPISQQDFHGLYSILASTRTSMRVLDAPGKLHVHDAELAALKTEIRAALAATWKEQIERWPEIIPVADDVRRRTDDTNAPANPPPHVGGYEAREVAHWRAAFTAAETNKSPLAPLLKALRSGAAVPAASPVGQPSRLPDSAAPSGTLGGRVAGGTPAPLRSGAAVPAASPVGQPSRLPDSAAPSGTLGGRAAGGTPAPLPLFADFSTGADHGWFATGGFARHSPAGDFALTASGSNILAAIYPAGRFSHLLSDKHAGTFRSPNFTVTNRFISALVTGDNSARVRLVIENFQGDSLLFTQVTPKLTDRSALRWVTLPIRDTWRNRRAYLELMPRDDMPYLGIVRDAAKLPADGRSAAGIAKAVFHDGEKPPEPPAWPEELNAVLDSRVGAATVWTAVAKRSGDTALSSRGAESPSPNRSAGSESGVALRFPPQSKTSQTKTSQTNAEPGEEEHSFATAFTAAARRAVDAWAVGKCDDAQASFLNSLLRLGLLENGTPVSDPARATPHAGPEAGAPNAKLAALLARYREVEARVPIPTRVVAVVDEGPGWDEPLFRRGDHLNPGALVPRGFLAALKPGRAYTSPGSGRRELAEDILASPLAARVMVNRLWHHVFGAGLVRTTDNFGQLGEAPSHPELLDWLASEFIAQGWSTKAMLRLMLTSRAFAMSTSEATARASGVAVPAAVAGVSPAKSPPNAGKMPALTGGTPAPLAERDPDNRLLAHAPLRRLDAESLRDALLAASGRLDRTLFGPSVPVPIPPSHRDDYSPADGPLDGRGRRSLYLEVRRNHPSPFLFAFDQPKPVGPVGRREPTNVPAQGLTLLNDPFVLQQAELFAQRALAQPGDAAARVRWLYATALSRPATDVEVTRASAFLAQQSAAHSGDEAKAWRELAHAVFNLKEFLYLK